MKIYFLNTVLFFINNGSCPGVNQNLSNKYENHNCLFPHKKLQAFWSHPCFSTNHQALLLYCLVLANSQSQQEKSHFISKKVFSSNPAPKISLYQSLLSISGTSLCNLSQYSFHTYESTQMANYASDGTELLCLIRDGSKILR